jgi:hypothetical protein
VLWVGPQAVDLERQDVFEIERPDTSFVTSLEWSDNTTLYYAFDGLSAGNFDEV